MPTEEEVKKEEERKFEERVNKRVAAEVTAARETARAAFEAQLAASDAEIKRLKAAEKARADAEEDAAIKRVADLKEKVDPALLALLPEKLPVLDQVDWLIKAAGEQPAPEKATMPVTPKGSKVSGKFEPMPVTHKPF